MANPSTTGGTGAGTEVLRRSFVKNGDFATQVKILDGAADHIYTILSITITNASGSNNEVVLMYIYPDATSGDETTIIKDMPLAAKETFGSSDKFILTATDELYLKTDDTSSLAVWVSYIDQTFA